jgi:hypothetical protein
VAKDDLPNESMKKDKAMEFDSFFSILGVVCVFAINLKNTVKTIC